MSSRQSRLPQARSLAKNYLRGNFGMICFAMPGMAWLPPRLCTRSNPTCLDPCRCARRGRIINHKSHLRWRPALTRIRNGQTSALAAAPDPRRNYCGCEKMGRVRHDFPVRTPPTPTGSMSAEIMGQVSSSRSLSKIIADEQRPSLDGFGSTPPIGRRQRPIAASEHRRGKFQGSGDRNNHQVPGAKCVMHQRGRKSPRAPSKSGSSPPERSQF